LLLKGQFVSERDTIDFSAERPNTVESLTSDLVRLGIESGTILLVHSSLSSIGWVSGGCVAVVLALESALGCEGTLVMPTHSGDLSDPKNWSNPPVPKSWWQTIRDTMPAYDPALTPTRGMGKIPETFRNGSRVVRSKHPQVSFAAQGPAAEKVTSDHSLEFGLGEGTPLSRVYDLDGWVLLLGVDHSSNTSLHLAEHRANLDSKGSVTTAAPVLENGTRQWVEFQELEGDISSFNQLGEDFATETGLVRQGQVGLARALLMPQRSLVDFATGWLEYHN